MRDACIVEHRPFRHITELCVEIQGLELSVQYERSAGIFGLHCPHQPRPEPGAAIRRAHGNTPDFHNPRRLGHCPRRGGALSIHQGEEMPCSFIPFVLLFVLRHLLLDDEDFHAYGKAIGERRAAEGTAAKLDHRWTRPITVLCGGMLGLSVGQRVAGKLKLAVGVAPGWRTMPNVVLVIASNAAPPMAAPLGAR